MLESSTCQWPLFAFAAAVLLITFLCSASEHCGYDHGEAPALASGQCGAAAFCAGILDRTELRVKIGKDSDVNETDHDGEEIFLQPIEDKDVDCATGGLWKEPKLKTRGGVCCMIKPENSVWKEQGWRM